MIMVKLTLFGFGLAITWQSVRSHLKRRKSGDDQLPIDRVWRWFFTFFALLGLLMVVLLWIDLTASGIVFTVYFALFVAVALGLFVCGFLVGWHSW